MFGLHQPDVPKVDASTVMEALTKKKTLFLLDVRTEQEYARGKIEGSINIPVDTVSQKVEEKFPDKNETIYVYCLSGSRSVSAVDVMQKMGYKNVFSMASGLLAWRAKGYPLTSPAS